MLAAMYIFKYCLVNLNDIISVPSTFFSRSYIWSTTKTATTIRDYYFLEHYTAMLVQKAEKLYNKLVRDPTNRITYDAAFSSSRTSSSSPSLSTTTSSDETKPSSSHPKSAKKYGSSPVFVNV
jgi:hypothetical protein